MLSTLVVTSEEKQQVRKYYGISDKEIKEDVEIIKTWMEKQPHLPQNLSDDLIEKVLLRNKFRVERTKQKLDNYYSLRGHHKDLISGFQELVPSKHITMFLPMPNLTKSLERIIIIKLLNYNPDDYNIFELIKMNLAIQELCFQYDYSIGTRYILDWEGFTLKYLPKFNPIAVLKNVTLVEQAYSQRILGGEFINVPSFFAKILSIFKMAVRPKIYERIRVHKTLDSLNEVIPKENLPNDYGGTLPPISDHLDKWDQVMKDHHDFFVENYKNVSIETLRPLKSKADEEIFGVGGTFKKLSID